MGSSDLEPGRRTSEGPTRTVTLAKPIAVAKFEITREEFDAYVSATKYPVPRRCEQFSAQSQRWSVIPGKSYLDPGLPQNEKHPVVCVGWAEAIKYAQWLAERTGKGYRLLSEAEWEYAARAGSTTTFWWGSTASHEFANYGTDACCNGLISGRDKWFDTAPVGQFPANAFGLHDMHGNVWEWVEDCWNVSYTGAPTDGSVWTSGNCQQRVARGGSSHSDATMNLRSAARIAISQLLQPINFGIRVARTLEPPP